MVTYSFPLSTIHWIAIYSVYSYLLRRGSFNGGNGQKTGKERENGEIKKSGARGGQWEGPIFTLPSVPPSLFFPSHHPSAHRKVERDLCGGERVYTVTMHSYNCHNRGKDHRRGLGGVLQENLRGGVRRAIGNQERMI